jgi:hypothetical protein
VDTNHIERAVLDYLHTIATGGAEGDHVAGHLAEIVRWTNELNPREKFFDRKVDFEALKVTRVDGDRATVDLKAQWSGTFRHPYGPHPMTADLTGEVTLRLVAGRWKLVDLHYDGTPVTQKWILLDGIARSEEGIEVAPLVTTIRDGGLGVIMAVANRRPGPVWMYEVFVSRLGRLRAGSLMEEVQLAPGEHRTLIAGFPMMLLNAPKSVDVIVPTYDHSSGSWLHPRARGRSRAAA